jgi:TonB family protein
MTAHKLLILITILISQKIYSQDTLFFKLSNPWNTVKDLNGKYIRKCVKENDYFHVWDYNSKNILVTESFYTDTNFTRKLFCHKYFNETRGFLEQSRCYQEGRLHGYFVSYSPAGDTTGYDIFENSTVIKSWRSQPEEAEATFVMNEKFAEFPGGQKAWLEFLSNNLQYPDSLQNIKGQVILKFVVSPMGIIENVEVIKSLHPILDQEAIRVIRKSPKWKPAKQNGKKVKTIIRQPIGFG